MMTILKFKPVAAAAICQSENGDYVRYSDYQTLAAELQEFKALIGQRFYYDLEESEGCATPRDYAVMCDLKPGETFEIGVGISLKPEEYRVINSDYEVELVSCAATIHAGVVSND